ncbi:MAG: winged helix-turn-helix transcriptional regulator [Nitrososphaeria archaeon]
MGYALNMVYPKLFDNKRLITMLPKLTVAMNHKMQDIQKVITNMKLLNLLMKKGRLRWQELKKSTDLSSRTLSDRLQELMDKDLVRRKVDPSARPPSTYYELNPNFDIGRLREGHLYSLYQTYLDKRNRSAGLLRIIERRTPKEVLENTFNTLRHDFLFTLNYCLENPDYAQHIVLLYLDSYQTQVKNLTTYIRKNRAFGDQVKEMFNSFIESQEKNARKVIEEALSNFEDKQLARAVLSLYFKKVFAYNMELYIFLVQVSQSKELRNELEKEFGEPVEEERLNKLISEESWKDLESFSAAYSQITSY